MRHIAPSICVGRTTRRTPTGWTEDSGQNLGNALEGDIWTVYDYAIASSLWAIHYSVLCFPFLTSDVSIHGIRGLWMMAGILSRLLGLSQFASGTLCLCLGFRFLPGASPHLTRLVWN